MMETVSPQTLSVSTCVTNIKKCVTANRKCVTATVFSYIHNNIMTIDYNKTILITGLIVGGIASLYWNQSELAYTIFGGLIGYLSKDTVFTIEGSEVSDGGSDSEGTR